MKKARGGYEVAVITHRGAVRERNEDLLSVDSSLYGGDMQKPLAVSLDFSRHVLMVADGMGGHAHGQLASRTALKKLTSQPSDFIDETTCADALRAANSHIYECMQLNPSAVGMGTTIVGAVLATHSLIHFNVGDSRAYRHKLGRLARISQDDVPAAGTSAGRRSSHLVTQALGGQPTPVQINPHIGMLSPLDVSETLVLCTDGLTDMVDEEQLMRAIDAGSDPETCASTLMNLALAAGGRDNVTIVIARAR